MLGTWNDFDRMLGAMDILQDRINRIFSDYGRVRTYPGSLGSSKIAPRTNIYDVGDHLEMKLEVPGILKEDLKVKVQGNYLEISGSRKSDAPVGYTAHRVERGLTSFTRSFTLASDVDTSKVEAKLANGLLTLILPKSEAAKPKQITVS